MSISVKDIFNCKTVGKIYEQVLEPQLADLSRQEDKLVQESGVLEGELELLPIQEWFLSKVTNKELKAAHHWNQSFLIRVNNLDKELLEYSLSKLVEYHDAFRLGYRQDEEGTYTQYYRNMEDLSLIKCNLGSNIHYLDISNHSSETEYKEILTSWQSNFDLTGSKPLYSIGYIDGYADGSSRIFFALTSFIGGCGKLENNSA